MARAAKTLAASFKLVLHNSFAYIPVHWDTYSPKPEPEPSETIWLVLEKDDMQEIAQSQHNILFANDSELRNFVFMLKQLARPERRAPQGILIRTPNGLEVLGEDGSLTPTHDGTFHPNHIQTKLNTNPDDKAEVLDVITEWVGSEDQATSLLRHLATALAPTYSAVKYVILLGEGRNGKSVLLSMLAKLFGSHNVSSVTRQMIAEASPTCVELNNKLLNIIFDGEMGYIKDSSMEKTLIAGEAGVVRMLYESGTTKVQTNALFIEALNKEPKTRDKSSALQKRLVRFKFDKVYELDHSFSKKMLGERMLGAFLSLLIDHYVTADTLAEKLSPTASSKDLQLDQEWMGSPVFQFLEFVHKTDEKFLEKLTKGAYDLDDFLTAFKPWLSDQGGQFERSDGDIISLLKDHFTIAWRTKRVNKKPTNRRVITSVKPETLAAIDLLKGSIHVEDAGEGMVGE